MDALLQYLQLTPFHSSDLLVVAVLVLLEGLLSCDNAVVLALLVKDLPPEQRGKALRYGIIGAYVFRIVALILATWIMSKWYLKVLGGVYLLWMGVSHLVKHYRAQRAEAEAAEAEAAAAAGNATTVEAPAITPAVDKPKWYRRMGLSAFWGTVLAVELTDIVFSVDSIAAAVALSDKLWVLILGGILGILAMRFAAQGFVTLLERFPHLENAAFAAVAFIGLKLLAEFPVDVLGREHRFAPGTTYATAVEYQKAVEEQFPPTVHVSHVVSINTMAAPEPEAARFTDPREYKRAHSGWNLHLRPFFELEGWLSSLLVVTIFCFGFRRPKSAAA